MSTPTRPRLLVVDDDAVQMRALCSTLEFEGYPTSGFTSPQQALSSFRENHFALVLTDLTMPEMDGIEFLRAIRSIDQQVIGIVMTGHGTIDTAVAAMKAGALDYVLKPFTLKTILPVLERAYTIWSLRTENKQLRLSERAARDLSSALEQRVQDRTRQLTDANRELEAFAHSVSHDLRGPLRAVNSFTHLLSEQYQAVLDERGRGYIGRVLVAADRMEHLIEDLMRLSHASVTELKRSDVDLSKMVSAIVDELQAREPERVVDAVIAPEMHCQADPQLLRIALENLVSNAWKFTRKLSAARIEFGRCADKPSTFFIRDNGAGFNPEREREMFAPFRRLHSAADFPGTGVGLSIVQRVLRRHGGNISAEGSVGHGATFYFSVPKGLDTPHPEGQ